MVTSNDWVSTFEYKIVRQNYAISGELCVFWEIECVGDVGTFERLSLETGLFHFWDGVEYAF
jgi:hypothetical protein